MIDIVPIDNLAGLFLQSSLHILYLEALFAVIKCLLDGLLEIILLLQVSSILHHLFLPHHGLIIRNINFFKTVPVKFRLSITLISSLNLATGRISNLHDRLRRRALLSKVRKPNTIII